MAKMRFLYELFIIFACLLGYLEAASVSKNSTNPGGWDTAFTDGSNLIPLVTFGDKSYYFGTTFKATFLEADQFCKDIHMELVRVQTADENDRLYKYVQEKTSEEHFWTAGSKLVDKTNWIWMTTGEVIDYTNWGSGLPDYPNSEFCLELWLFKNKGLYFDDRECSNKFAFICEKDKRRPQTTQSDKDSKWASVFQQPTVSPNINLLHYEGKSYYFGIYFKATYLQATQFCEIINMKLVSITSEAENSRLHKYIRDSSLGDGFWSSGSKAIDGKTWVWLSTGKYVDYTNWKPGQPDHTDLAELCIYLEQQKDTSLVWHDHGCDNQFNFICEKYDFPYPLGPGPVILPTETPYTTSPVTERAVQYPENPSLPETTVDGRKYRVSKYKATESKADQTCKQYGMELVSIPDKNKNDIVTNLIGQSGNPASGSAYWTSARKQSDGKWVWWDLQPIAAYTNWAPGEPNNADKNETCLQVYTTGKWNDLNCIRECYFICESPKTGTPGKDCPSQPVVNIYVNNNQCSNNGNVTVSEPKKIATTKNGEGCNIEVNNNVAAGSCSKTIAPEGKSKHMNTKHKHHV